MSKEKSSKPTKVDKKKLSDSVDKDKAKKSKDKSADENKQKHDGLNTRTRTAGLTFNVNSTGKWLAKYYTDHHDAAYIEVMQKKYDERQLKKKSSDKKPDKKDAKNKKDKKDAKSKSESEEVKDTSLKVKPTFRECQTAITIVEEVLCLALLGLAGDKAKKEKSGLYTITDENLMDGIKLNSDYYHTFSRCLAKYDSGQTYSSSLNLSEPVVTKFIEEFGFTGGNTHIRLSSGAYNFLMYILLKNRILLADTAYQIMMHGKKYSIGYKCIETSVNIHYTGTLKNMLVKKLDEKRKLVFKEKPSDESDSGSTKSDDKKGKDKKDDKKDDKKAKKAKDDDSDDESEEETESESEDDSDGESD
jgi:hypothetical protein